MEKLKELNEIKHSLIEAAKSEIGAGLCNVDTEEMGAVVDMIKDLASAEKDCMEACYYELLAEDMDGGESERMGYDRWRYSSGRFAPKGKGSRMGYMPPYMDDNMRYPERDGRTIPTARAGYTPSKGADRKAMGFHDGMEPREKLDKAIDVMGDVWTEADTETKQKMKSLVTDLLDQMERAGV